MNNLRDEWAALNEAEIAKRDDLPAHNKQTLRAMLTREDREELERLRRQEEGTSTSPVGDQFSMGGNRE